MKIKQRIQNEKGYSAADLSIAIIILILFVSLITTVYYNYYMSVAAKNRQAAATNAVIDVMEQIEKMPYETVDTQSAQAKIQELYEQNKIAKGYTVTALVEKYNEMPANTQKEDLIKTVKVTVQYTVSDKTQTIEMSHLITK